MIWLWFFNKFWKSQKFYINLVIEREENPVDEYTRSLIMSSIWLTHFMEGNTILFTSCSYGQRLFTTRSSNTGKTSKRQPIVEKYTKLLSFFKPFNNCNSTSLAVFSITYVSQHKSVRPFNVPRSITTVMQKKCFQVLCHSITNDLTCGSVES